MAGTVGLAMLVLMRDFDSSFRRRNKTSERGSPEFVVFASVSAS